MNPKNKKWIKSIFFNKKFIELLISFFVGLVFCFLATSDRLKDFFLFTIIILVVLSIFLAFLYLIDTSFKLDELNTNEFVANDVKIINFEKIIKIDNQSNSAGCEIKEIREIRNNMDQDCPGWFVKNSNRNDYPKFENFKFYVDDEELLKNVDEMSFKTYPDTDYSEDPPTTEKAFRFRFPINIESHDVKTLKVEYRCQAFTDAQQLKRDFIQFSISWMTERIHIAIILLDDWKTNHLIDFPQEINPKTREYFDIEITDKFGHRMWISEENLKKEGMMPQFNPSKTRMDWTVYRPKIGYQYRVYFKFFRKNQ